MERTFRRPRPKWPRATYAFLASLPIGACDTFTQPIPCLLYAEIGIVAIVTDSVGGGAVAADSVFGTVTDGVYVEHRRTTPPYALSGLYFAEERAGSYQVAITAEGYQPWIMDGVNVTRDECHVVRVTLDVRLQPT